MPSMDKKRVCFVAHKFPVMSRSSDNNFLWTIAKGLSDKGFEVVAIATKSPLNKPLAVRDSVEVHFIHEGPDHLAHLPVAEGIYRKFVELHKKKPFQIVHSIDKSGRKIAYLKKKLNVKVVFDVQAIDMGQVFSILGMQTETASSFILSHLSAAYKFVSTYLSHDREITKNADGIIVTTPQQRKFLESYYIYPDKKIYTIPYGIELSNLELRDKIDDIKIRCNLIPDANYILTISDLTNANEVKNILLAFTSVAIQKNNTYLLILGTGPEWTNVENYLLNQVLGNRAFMLGAKKNEEISDYISASDILVDLSSRSTGLDPIMIEAMSQRKVVIGSEVSPMANILEDSQDGFLIRPADTKTLSQLMLKILNERPIADSIGEKARQKALNIFDINKMINSIADFYSHIK